MEHTTRHQTSTMTLSTNMLSTGSYHIKKMRSTKPNIAIRTLPHQYFIDFKQFSLFRATHQINPLVQVATSTMCIFRLTNILTIAEHLIDRMNSFTLVMSMISLETNITQGRAL